MVLLDNLSTYLIFVVQGFTVWATVRGQEVRAYVFFVFAD